MTFLSLLLFIRQQFNENWSFSRLKSVLNIVIDGECVFFENLDLHDSESGSIAAKVGYAGVFGTLILIGPKTLSVRLKADELYYNRDTFDQHVSVVIKRQKLNSSADKTLNYNNSSNHNSSSCRSSSVSVTHLHYGASSSTQSSSSASSCVMSVVRIIAPNAEEGYNLMSNILSPLVDELGYLPYFDRIHSS